MAFGAGVLISALAFDLVLEANDEGGLLPTVAGFVVGAVAYVSANEALDRFDKRNPRGRGRTPARAPASPWAHCSTASPSRRCSASACSAAGSVSVPVLVAIIISNVPEGLSSTAELKRSGRSARYVFALWIGIALVSAVAAIAGFVLLDGAPATTTAFITAIAAGAILAMICDTMIPEAFRTEGRLTGLLATFGFVLSFAVHQLA